jgi:site-specific DNA-cytosine methylase
MKAIDCQGLGGGFTLGVKLSGIDIVSKHEQPGGFGFDQVNENRHLLGDFPLDDAPAAEWTVDEAPYVFGCPPCSGFSSMSIRAGGEDKRGREAAINGCMWDWIRYVAKVRPLIATMESVPAAAKDREKGGLLLMRALQQELMDLTGHGWYLTLLHHNSLSVGGPSQRPRVFMVFSQQPFGITTPRPSKLPVLRDVLGDLEPLPLQWEEQPRLVVPSWWAERKVDTEFVNGHIIAGDGRRKDDRIAGLHEVGLPEGSGLTKACEAYWTATGGEWDRETGQIITDGQFPPGYDDREKQRILYRPAEKALDATLIREGRMTNAEYNEKWGRKIDATTFPRPFITSMYETIRWSWEKPARVLHGGGLHASIHPTQPRTFTYREAARIMGFPDSWNLEAYKGHEPVFGKAVTVDVAFWLGHMVQQHLDGLSTERRDDLWYGEDSDGGYLETTIDCSRDWQALEDSKSGERKRKELEGRPA